MEFLKQTTAIRKDMTNKLILLNGLRSRKERLCKDYTKYEKQIIELNKDIEFTHKEFEDLSKQHKALIADWDKKLELVGF